MPAQPTKEQFQAAAQKVLKSAPEGLSRDAFFALVDKEIAAGDVHPVGADENYQTGGWGDWLKGAAGSLKHDFLDATVNNPLMKAAAHPGLDMETGKEKSIPDTLGDVSTLLLPSEAVLGSAKGFVGAGKNLLKGASEGAAEREGLKKIPAVIKGMYKAATKEDPIANFERNYYASGGRRPNTTSVPDSGVPQGPLPESTGSMVDRYKPNVSSTPDMGVPQGEMPAPPVELESAQDVMARSPKPTSAPVQTDRIPYGPSHEHAPVDAVGAVSGKAPSLQDVLQQALEEQMGKGEPATLSTSPDVVPTGGSQKPRLGKRPGGYTTDLPAVTPTRSDELLGKLGGKGEGAGTMGSPAPPVESGPPSFKDTMMSTEPEMDWHSGAEPGSPEAKSAQVHHRSAGEMDADYKRRIADPKGEIDSLLAILLGGGAAAAPLISHALKPQD